MSQSVCIWSVGKAPKNIEQSTELREFMSAAASLMCVLNEVEFLEKLQRLGLKSRLLSNAMKLLEVFLKSS